jgi:nicotinic acid mononucleotide adenylyltransferase
MDEPSADRDLGEAVYSVGRFQPPTIGHAAMIRALIATGKPAFVFVSSSTEPKASNPLESKDKVAHLRKMFPSGVTFVDTKADCPDAPCGGPIGGYRYLVKAGYTELTLVGGSDREKTFGPDAPL